MDPGTEGFKGVVTNTVTYTLKNGAIWDLQMLSTASEKTPIMLSSHTYWNLEAYKESEGIQNHTLWIDASRIVATDSTEIPTGEIKSVEGTPWDFRTPASFGTRIPETVDSCGPGEHLSIQVYPTAPDRHV